MEKQKVLMQVLILVLLSFSYVLSLGTVAAPLSRSLKLGAHGDSSTTQANLVLQGNFMDEVLVEDEEDEGFFLHGRMVAESNDYPGSGANNRHDPKPPPS